MAGFKTSINIAWLRNLEYIAPQKGLERLAYADAQSRSTQEGVVTPEICQHFMLTVSAEVGACQACSPGRAERSTRSTRRTRAALMKKRRRGTDSCARSDGRVGCGMRAICKYQSVQHGSSNTFHSHVT